MSERVVEILIYIMSELRRSKKYSQKLDLLSEDLIERGYTESEISSALTWLVNRLNLDSEEVVQRQEPALRSHRHLHEIERTMISTAAYGYIIQLKELGILDDLEVEEVLERTLMLGTAEVEIEDIKSVVTGILFRNEGFADGTHLLLEENSIIH